MITVRLLCLTLAICYIFCEGNMSLLGFNQGAGGVLDKKICNQIYFCHLCLYTKLNYVLLLSCSTNVFELVIWY